ncbi:hypothetical protein [Streptomyces griseiscabiei]|uniref:Secreted protein n=2 Tax=Streptomyces TaxID=1883 RepID=A0ABU4L172_9ACTN|nr:hypothetical protein [Streptomyces griseiscabiei]MBZ3905863.1 hypothetical protein [Streptomyces griseiscabiei]MDX2909492.1 hypothetical protein [Streptomyces griseiscabiei]
MRRVAAAVVLLAATLLLHLATPHHPATPPDASPGIASAAVTGPDAVTGSVVVTGSAVVTGSVVVMGSAQAKEGTAAHHEASADTLVRPARADRPRTEPTTAVAGPTDAPADARPASGTTRPRTARDSRTPSTGAAPTPSALQTFRH